MSKSGLWVNIFIKILQKKAKKIPESREVVNFLQLKDKSYGLRVKRLSMLSQKAATNPLAIGDNSHPKIILPIEV